MGKKRTIFRKLNSEDTKNRNEKMYKKFQKLLSTGKYGKMKLYEMLADEFDIEERNSVYGIIKKVEKQKELA